MDADQLSDVIDERAKALAGMRGSLLPLLHAVQEEVGWVPDEAVPLIANALNRSRAEVHGVVTFYPDFRRRPAGSHVIKLCRAEACQARGVAGIERRLTEKLSIAMNETRADGRVSLEAVYCLGLCASGPNALVDNVPLSRIDERTVDRIVAQVMA